MDALPIDHLPLRRFADITGRDPSGIRHMIRRGELAEGRHYVYNPKGRIEIVLSGWNEWVWSGLDR